MITGRDIIIVGQQPWDTEIGSNCKNIALEFSKHNRVLYVNAPLDRITRFRERNDPKVKTRLDVIAGKADAITEIKENLWSFYPDIIIESINWIKNVKIHSFINYLNNKRIEKTIIKAIRQLGFKDYILFNDGDMFRGFYLNELLNPSSSIYYSRDYLLATDYYKFHGPRIEPLLIKKSTLCVANSTFLADYCRKFNPNSYYVGQGCEQSEEDTLENLEVPPDMQQMHGPVIGYVGALLSSRLDIHLLINIANFRTDWQLVLVGPQDDVFKQSELHQLKNVYFLGPKDSTVLPNYINAFDVCINPQVINMLTIGNYPRKVDEYLAMGKPVVATHTPAMDIFEKHVYLVKEKAEYLLAINMALKENNEGRSKERQEFAKTHTWENSVNEIYNAIEAVTKNTSQEVADI